MAHNGITIRVLAIHTQLNACNEPMCELKHMTKHSSLVRRVGFSIRLSDVRTAFMPMQHFSLLLYFPTVLLILNDFSFDLYVLFRCNQIGVHSRFYRHEQLSFGEKRKKTENSIPFVSSFLRLLHSRRFFYYHGRCRSEKE